MKLCEYCHQPFEPRNGNQKLCDRPHYKECVVCGTKFEVPNSRLREKDCKCTCSRKCSVELRKRTNQLKYGGNAPACSTDVQSKMRETTKQRFGVEHASQSDVCKEKSKKTNLEKYGVDHYSKTEEAKQNLSNLYKNESYVEKVNSNRVRTNQARYGVDNVMQHDGIRNQRRDAYYCKTGYREPFANPDIRARSVETLYRNYGVTSPIKCDEIKDRIGSTNLQRYGFENPMQNDEVLKRSQDAIEEKFGSRCYFTSEIGRKRISETHQKRYNSNWFVGSDKWLELRMSDPSKIELYQSFLKSPTQFIETHFQNKPTLKALSEYLGICSQTLGVKVRQLGIEDSIEYVCSYMELEVYEFLQSLNLNTEIIQNTRQIIKPYELDIYLPQYNFAIECNPTETHNSSFNIYNSEPTLPSYHKMKTDMCAEKEIQLFHIFGYEWEHKKDIIKSMVRNKLNRTPTKIYARDTYVEMVDPKSARLFLDTNHRQGYSAASIRMALRHKHSNEIVSLMTFSKSRKTISENSYESDSYELVRFCSVLNTSVIGGASKLFNYFIKTYSPNSIVSFSDRSHTCGKLYSTLGFQPKRISDPGYVWVDVKTNTAYHRMNAQKHNIQKFLKDDSIDLTQTERQIMESHGYVQVFDSGTICWVWDVDISVY